MTDCCDAVWGLLTDSLFSGLNPALLQSNIFHKDSIDTAPRDQPFAILSWESWEMHNSRSTMRKRVFSVWVHAPRRVWLDHTVTRNILDRAIAELVGAVNVSGSDGILSSCDLMGISGDLTDDGHQTIANYATFKAGVR